MLIDNFDKKQNLLNFLFQKKLITKNEHFLGLKIKNAFQKLKFYSFSLSFEERIQGGKSVDLMTYIYDSNREYNNLVLDLEENEKEFLNLYVCSEKKIKDFDKSKLLEVIEISAMILNKLLYIFRSDFNLCKNEVIMMLTRLIYSDGVKKISKLLKIDRRAIYSIVQGSNNFKYYNLQKLLDYYHICF